MSDSRECSISSWLKSELSTYIQVRPANDKASWPELIGRARITLESGPVTISLRPTKDELRALIDALEWALAAQPATAVAA